MHVQANPHTCVYVILFNSRGTRELSSWSIPTHVGRAIPEVRISVKGEPRTGG